jgi:hypothetical protein
MKSIRSGPKCELRRDRTRTDSGSLHRFWVANQYIHSRPAYRLSIPSRDDIVASPIREDAPPDGATSGYYSGQTPQGAGGRHRPASPIMDDPSAELERELAGTHIGRQ